MPFCPLISNQDKEKCEREECTFWSEGDEECLAKMFFAQSVVKSELEGKDD